MIVNNFHLIYPLLEFKTEGDFYYIQLLQRKKDQDVPANHQSVRTIKTYIVESVEYIKNKEQEIIDLCEYFKARAGINLHLRNHKNLSLDVLQKSIEMIKSGNYNLSSVYDKVIGNNKSKTRPVWTLDLDEKDYDSVLKIINHLLMNFEDNNLKGQIYEILPTYSGYHLLTTPFNTLTFEKFKTLEQIPVEIQKCNPCALYYPEKI